MSPLNLVVKTHKDHVELLTIVVCRKGDYQFDLKFQWADPVLPCCVLRWLYKGYRKLVYGQTRDRRILHMNLAHDYVSSVHFSERVRLDRKYHWNKIIPAPTRYHLYPLSKLAHEDGQPVIYIASWSHIFAKSVFDPSDYVTVAYDIEWE